MVLVVAMTSPTNASWDGECRVGSFNGVHSAEGRDATELAGTCREQESEAGVARERCEMHREATAKWVLPASTPYAARDKAKEDIEARGPGEQPREATVAWPTKGREPWLGNWRNPVGESGVLRSAAEREQALLQHERELLERERKLLERERELLNGQSLVLEKSMVGYREIAEQLLPEFEPSLTLGFTAVKWVRRVESIASAYGWDESMLLAQSVSKLRGAAKLWLNSVAEEVHSWEAFKKGLLYCFPSVEDQADVHLSLTKRRMQRGETHESYVYAMKTIARRGEVNEASLIKYILNGMWDKELVKLLTMCDVEDVEGLLRKIRRYESVTDRANFHNRPPVTIDKRAEVKEVRGERTHTQGVCFNCGKEGHLARECRVAARKRICYRCKQTGHMQKDCLQATPRTTQNEKKWNVRKITRPNCIIKDEYHKWIDINDDRVVVAFS